MYWIPILLLSNYVFLWACGGDRWNSVGSLRYSLRIPAALLMAVSNVFMLTWAWADSLRTGVMATAFAVMIQSYLIPFPWLVVIAIDAAIFVTILLYDNSIER